MAEKRIAIIVKEIHYWKQHKLLPDVYCDYLLALYTKGEETSVQTQPPKVSMIIQLTLLFFLVPFSFLVIYFTEFHWIMQLGILILFVGFAFWQYVYNKGKRSLLYQTPLLVLLLLLLLSSIFFVNQFSHNQWIANGLFFMHFISWFLLGQNQRLNYLKSISIIGIILTAVYIVL